MLRSLIEKGVLARNEHGWEVSALVETLRVPDTLQGVLLSRLDRLPEESKRVIQKAAVIGRVFFYRILEQMGGGQDQLDPQLSALQEADLVRERSRVPEVEYIFKHALTQEVAYQTLLAPARKLLHQKVGEAMEESLPSASKNSAVSWPITISARNRGKKRSSIQSNRPMERSVFVPTLRRVPITGARWNVSSGLRKIRHISSNTSTSQSSWWARRCRRNRRRKI